jgi:hypothetical protein
MSRRYTVPIMIDPTSSSPDSDPSGSTPRVFGDAGPLYLQLKEILERAGLHRHDPVNGPGGGYYITLEPPTAAAIVSWAVHACDSDEDTTVEEAMCEAVLKILTAEGYDAQRIDGDGYFAGSILVSEHNPEARI